MATFRYERRAGSLVVVQARIWGPQSSGTVDLAVDTGSLFTVLSESTLEKAGYTRSMAIGARDIATASRIERRPVQEVRLATLGFPPRMLRVVSHTLPVGVPIDGLLGLDFLQDRRLTIDFRQRTIELT